MKNKTLNRCYKIAKPHLKTIILVYILSIVIDILELSKPYLVKVVIDDFLSLGLAEKGFISITTIGVLYLFIVVIRKCFRLYNKNENQHNGGRNSLYFEK